MAKFKVVVTDREYENLEHETRILSEVGAELYDYQYKNEDQIIEVAKDCDALIIQYAHITESIINSLEKCKVISKYATGIETIDIPAATKKGICVTNVSNYCTDEVSTHAVSLLLSLYRKISFYDKMIKSDQWGYKRGAPIISIRKSIIGIIGYGNISSAFVKKIRTICDEVWVYSNSATEETLAQAGAKRKSFDEVIAHADFISIHSPLTDKTRYLFNKDVFQSMKPTASIINVSRGPLVKEEDLIWALENGEIASAALDVMEKEPPNPNNKLLTMDNVILSPHIAWYSTESQKALQSTTAMNAAAVLSGYYPPNLVNPEVKNSVQLKEQA